MLYLVDGLGLSGKTKALGDLSPGSPRALPRRGLLLRRRGQPAGRAPARLDVPVHEVPCHDGLDVGVVARLGAIVRRLRPRVVHCYNPRPMLYGGTVARLAASAPPSAR